MWRSERKDTQQGCSNAWGGGRGSCLAGDLRRLLEGGGRWNMCVASPLNVFGNVFRRSITYIPREEIKYDCAKFPIQPDKKQKLERFIKRQSTIW